ncbi:MAG TPA: diacylglycerol kinase family protein [Gemmatimonadales bacterium]|nr:diacylglycerol kinase family protein [Gemmatimonadales bacterium]
MEDARIILNPAASGGAAARCADAVVRAFRTAGWNVELARTGGPGDGARLAADASRAGVPRVVALGGDGTVHDVANGLLSARGTTALGVLPAGTGNDFAKLAGMHRHHPVKAVPRLIHASVTQFDAGHVLDEYFVNTLGVGLDAAVVRTRNAMPYLKGFVSYLVPVLRTFFSYRPIRFRLTSPDFQREAPMMQVEVCNGTTAGGDYRFAPDANPADGLLDVCLTRGLSLPRFLGLVPRVMRGTHVTSADVTMFRTRELTIRSLDAPLLMHLDGELRSPATDQCTIRLEPRCLPVLVAR